ncbi:MAG TPA: 3-phosphoshikimate 1-carboxyvinyltransferase [Acidimicrobiia bacterium]
MSDEATFGGARPLRGSLRLPGDKSLSHRSLIFAAVARGTSRLRSLAPGADVAATRRIAGQLGVRMRDVDDAAVITGHGFTGLREAEDLLDCANSGTSMRVLAGLLAGRPFLSVLAGDGSLSKRPMARVVEPLRAMGAAIDGRHDGTLAPLTIRGGGITGARLAPAVASAQVKSAIMLAALQAEGATEITEPARSRDHTERMLTALGASVAVDGRTVRVEPIASLDAPWDGFDIDVPGDPSSAAFFAVAAVITPGSEVVLEHVAVNPTRLGFVDVLRRMGAPIEVHETGVVLGEPVGDIVVRSAPLVATTLEGDEIPSVLDEIPVLAVAAAFADGVTEIRDAAELVVKESNRIGAIQQELAQLGIGVEARADGLTIRGGVARSGSPLKSHGDHRIAMMAAVAAHGLEEPSVVRGWQCVAVSYPAFAEDLQRLAGEP